MQPSMGDPSTPNEGEASQSSVARPTDEEILALSREAAGEASAEKIDLAEAIIGYKFKDDGLLWEALQRQGRKLRQRGQDVLKGGKRLAVLGDRVRELVICKQWYEAGDNEVSYAIASEAAGSNWSDAATCEKLGLDKCMIWQKHHEQPPSNKTLSTLLEAIIGAVYLDSGNDLDMATQVMENLGIEYFGEAQSGI